MQVWIYPAVLGDGEVEILSGIGGAGLYRVWRMAAQLDEDVGLGSRASNCAITL